MATKVFISYQRNSRPFVLSLKNALSTNSIESWVDLENIPISTEWWIEIKRGIVSADVFIFVLTAASIQSQVCNWELAFARSLNKRILPIILENIFSTDTDTELAKSTYQFTTPDGLDANAADNWGVLRQTNGARVFSEPLEGHIEAIVDVIEADLTHLLEHTRLSERAQEWQAINRNRAFLLRGDDLRDAETWLANASAKNPPPTALQSAYIVASRQNTNRTLRSLLAGVSIALAVSLALALLASYFFQEANNEANQRATAQFIAEDQSTIAINEANQRATAQSNAETQQFIAEDQSTLAISEANQRATAQSNAETQQYIAEEQSTIAVAQAATAQRNADVSQSLLLADSADEVRDNGDYNLALSLAVAAASIENPPSVVQQILADLAYAPGRTRSIRTDYTDVGPIAYSPNGERLLMGACAETNNLRRCIAGTVLVWDVVTMTIIETVPMYAEAVNSVAYSVSGDRFITGGCVELDENHRCIAGVATVWDTQTFEPIQTLTGQHSSPVWLVALSEDGQTAYTSANDRRLVAWDLATGDRRTVVDFGGVSTSVLANMLIRTDLGILATAGCAVERTDGECPSPRMDIWDITTGDNLLTLTGHNEMGGGLDINSDGTRLVSGATNGELVLWDLQTGDIIATATTEQGSVSRAVFSPDDRYILGYNFIASSDIDVLTLWDAATLQLLYIFQGNKAFGPRIAFNPVGPDVIISAAPNNVTVLSVLPADRLFTHYPHDGSVRDIAFSPDGNTALTVSCAERAYGLPLTCATGELAIWDVATGANLQTIEGHDNAIVAVIFSPDGTRAATASADDTVMVWDLETGAALHTYRLPDNANDVAFSPDGAHIAAAGDNTTVIVWDVESEERLLVFSEHRDSVLSLAYSPDGRSIVSFSTDYTLLHWDAATGEVNWSYESDTLSNTTILFTPDGEMVLFSRCVTRDQFACIIGEILALDADTGETIRSLRGHPDFINAIAVSADGARVASASNDATVILWDLQSGQALRTFTGHASAVRSVALSPDGSIIASGSCATSDDNCRMGELIFWRLQDIESLLEWVYDNRVVDELTCEQRDLYNVLPRCDTDS